MPLLFFEGFETVGTETGLANQATTRPNIHKRWDDTVSGSIKAQDSYFLIDDEFSEGYAIQMGNNGFSNGNYLQWDVPDALQVPAGSGAPTFIIGLRVHIPSTARTDDILQFRGQFTTGSDAKQISIGYTNSSGIYVSRGTVGTIIASNTNVFAPGDWHYMEVEIKMADYADGGKVIIRVDESTVIDEDPIDANDAMSLVSCNRILFETTNATTDTDDFVGYDDIYIANKETTEEFLGPTRVRSLPPSGDYSKNWNNVSTMTLAETLDSASETTLDVGTGGIPDGTPQTGYLYVELDTGRYRQIEYTAHDNDDEFTIVDESWSSPNDATAGNDVELRDELDNYRTVDENGVDTADYINTDQTQAVDVYHLTNDSSGLPTDSEVYGVKLEVEAINPVGGTPSVELRIDSNGSVVTEEFDVDSTTTYVVFHQYAFTDPDGDTTWTIAAVNDTKAGMKMDNKLN